MVGGQRSESSRVGSASEQPTDQPAGVPTMARTHPSATKTASGRAVDVHRINYRWGDTEKPLYSVVRNHHTEGIHRR